MVVLYGGLLFIFCYLTYLTMISRENKREIKRLKTVSKEYKRENELLKAQINGKAETERTATDANSNTRTGAVYTDRGESRQSSTSYPRRQWWKTIGQSF